MTGDELDRAIQFLLESQARNDAQMARNDAQIASLTGDSADFKALVREFVESTWRFAERADARLERLEQNAERRDRHLERLEENAKRDDGRLQRLETALADLAEEMKSLIHVVEGHVTDEARHRRPPG